MLVTVVVEEQVLLEESSSFDLANELVVPINSMVVVVYVSKHDKPYICHDCIGTLNNPISNKL